MQFTKTVSVLKLPALQNIKIQIIVANLTWLALSFYRENAFYQNDKLHLKYCFSIFFRVTLLSIVSVSRFKEYTLPAIRRQYSSPKIF